MKKITLTFLILLCFSALAKIPIDEFFKPSEFKNMTISPDGSMIAGIFEGEDISDQVSILSLKDGKIENLSNFQFGPNRRVGSLSWANNEHIVMNVSKTVGFLDRKAKFEGVYLAKYNGKMREYIYSAATGKNYGQLRSALKDDPEHILIDMFPARVKKHNIKSGKAKKINTPPAHGSNQKFGVFLDHNQKTRISIEGNDKGELFFFYLPESQSNWEELQIDTSKADYDVRVYPVGHTANPNVVYVFSNHEHPLLGLYTFNMNTGDMKFVYRHDRVDLGGTITDKDDNVVGITIEPDYRQTVWIKPDSSLAQLTQSLQASFPNQTASIINSTNDQQQHIVYVRSDVNPGQFYLYNSTENKLQYLASTRPNLDKKKLSEMKPITVTARDGVVLHGYLTLPQGKEPKNLPLIVNPHGGPHGPRDSWGFNSETQYLADRGYAVLQINFRGSGGYGRAFEESGYLKWGREMQDDVTDATLWAVEQGYADKNRLCIYGGSYGGYAALQGVVREPDLYKCAIGYVGVYDMTKFMTCGDGAGQKSRTNILTRYIGDDKEIHKKYSPAFNVDKIKADLFIAHGEDDVRVPMCQGNSLKNALEEANIPFKWMVRDEGHGYQKIENRRDFYTAMVEFFEKNIGN